MTELANKPSAAERIAAAEERRHTKANAEADAREAQFADDLEAIEALENKTGNRIRYSKQVPTFVPGHPVVVGVRAPDAAEYKRMTSLVNRAGANNEAKLHALLDLGRACWVYPDDPASRTAMTEANAGLLASVGVFANSLAEVDLREQGKEHRPAPRTRGRSRESSRPASWPTAIPATTVSTHGPAPS